MFCLPCSGNRWGLLEECNRKHVAPGEREIRQRLGQAPCPAGSHFVPQAAVSFGTLMFCERGERWKLAGVLWGFTSLPQSPLVFEMPAWYLHSAQLLIPLRSVTQAPFQQRCVIAGGGKKREANVFSVSLVAASMITCSVLLGSLRSCSPILAGNSDKTRHQSTRMHFLKAFNVSFSSGFFPSDEHSINTSAVQGDYVPC